MYFFFHTSRGTKIIYRFNKIVRNVISTQDKIATLIEIKFQYYK